ncbi:hypothetical protein HELRODRAFT_84240, partial [Helobdella robusta]|uniref:Prefoldin subunit 4 n=1 Tax=Helobdella robusta TaxID=6412 RepID=T1G5G2_HELRO
DVEVTYEDQMKINSFARNNASLQDLKEELDLKKKSLQNLEDAESDVLMMDDSEETNIPYQIGEFFVCCNQSDVLLYIEKEKADLDKDIKEMENKADNFRKILADLKVQLYAKFGTNINLEAEDE